MSIPANIGAVLADPAVVAQADEVLSGGKAREMICGTYREMITLPSATASYSEFYRGLHGDAPGPILFHCTTGKDRTGVGGGRLPDARRGWARRTCTTTTC